MASLTAFITRRLKLQVNMAKSAVVPARALSFLGFGFTDGSRPKRRLAAFHPEEAVGVDAGRIAHAAFARRLMRRLRRCSDFGSGSGC